MHVNDQLAELAKQIVLASKKAGLHVRLAGGIGFWIRLQEQRSRLLRLGRTINDIDLVAERGTQNEVTRLLAHQWGMEPDMGLVAIPELERTIHLKPSSNGPPVVCDVNYGGFRYSHFIDLSRRLLVNPLTLSLADLLISKLQIRKLSNRDAMDALVLLLQYDVGSSSNDDVIDLTRITYCCANDFGLTQTILLNLLKLNQHIPTVFGNDSSSTIELLEHRLGRLENSISKEPKPFIWKACQLWSRAFPRFKWHSEVDDFVPSSQDR